MHQPCQDQFLLLPSLSHITLQAFVRFESNHFSKTMIFVFHPTHHQVTKSSQNSKITKLGYAPSTPRSIPFVPKLFPHHFVGICEVWAQPLFQNHDFCFSHHIPPSHKIKQKHENHQTWLYTNHTKINSFCCKPFPTSLWRHLWGLNSAKFKKPWFFVFHTTHHQVTKSSQNNKINKLGYTPTIQRSIPFASKVFPHYFGGICDVWDQSHF